MYYEWGCWLENVLSMLFSQMNANQKLVNRKSLGLKQFVENFLIIFAAFVLQSYVIFPVEEYLRADQNTYIVSFIYVPHGIKVALILAYGLSATPAIITGMMAINLLSASSLSLDSLMIPGSIIGTVCVVIPLLFHNLSSRKSIFAAPMFDGESNRNNLWLYLSFAFASSVLNSLGQSAINNFDPAVLPWMFLLGDLVGTVTVFVVLVFLVRPALLKTLKKNN